MPIRAPETARPPARPTPLIDDPAELLEELRCPVNLVENDQPILVFPQEERGGGQLLARFGRLQIQVEGVPARGYLMGQRRLARLARADQRHYRLAPKPVHNGLRHPSVNQHCNINVID